MILQKGFIIAFMSEFIPRMVYKYGIGKGSLEGYVTFTLSQKNVQDIKRPPLNHNVTICKLRK